MSEFQAFAEFRDGVLHVRTLDAEPARSMELRCVLDLNDFGDVIGVEVLDLARQLDGGAMDPLRRKGAISWSYDDEIDALYIHVAEGRGQVQRSAVGSAHLDSSGRVVALAIPVPGAP